MMARRKRPSKSILDPEFRYVPSTATDLRKTFARIRREQAKERAEAAARVTHHVIPIKERTK
jgi:hypothetical protein